MVTIGIVGAMEEEVDFLIHQMTDVTEEEIAGLTFYHGDLMEKDTVVVQTGIGKVNMAACTQLLITAFHVDMLINIGVAGSLRDDVHVGDIVVSEKAVQYDFSVEGLPSYQEGLIPGFGEELGFRADVELVSLACQAARKVLPEYQCYTGTIVTGDQFIAKAEAKKHLAEEFDGLCTEMEGGAMAQVAVMNHVPFVIIRSISDEADENALKKFETHEELAIVNTIKVLLGMYYKI